MQFVLKIVVQFLVLSCVLVTISLADAGELFRINVVEEGTGWPVPLVELRTTHGVRLVSDNAGVVAFDLPELMNTETWLSVEGHGYTVPADGFGFHGVRVTPTPGGEYTLRVKRQLPARRLGRITGSGLFAEAQRFGEYTDWREQGILGCDSVLCAAHHGKLFWAWGDTTLARYPLGLFDTLSGTTELRPLKEFAPPIRLRYDYFKDSDGNPRAVADMPGDGPTWLSGYTSIRDSEGKQRLVATYNKIRPPLTAYETGLCVWNESEKRFEKHQHLWSRTDGAQQPPPAPQGHAARWTDEDGEAWLLFGNPFPAVKCHDSFEAWSDPQQWQILKPQERVATAAGEAQIVPHRGSIAYSPFRQKWVAVFTQLYGETSPLGEIWYAEADAPTGPWHSAIHVVTHNNYTFYNPRLHPAWVAGESPVLLFEATYTATFAGHAHPTPRHDYNQILYRLDLDRLSGEGRVNTNQ